jgi:peptidoglycan/LPS O-acetylase OafA/YrhL
MTPALPPEYGGLPAIAFAACQRAGWAGVDLFFVLSGFLVSGLLFREHIREGRVSFSRFFVRRGLKIYPAFWVLLLVYGLFEWRYGRTSYLGRPFTWSGWICEALYVQNYVSGLWNHTWSLAVEEHFYLLVGLLLTWLSTRGGLAATVKMCSGVLVGCLALRIYAVAHGHPVMFATHFRMDSLMFGVLLAYFYHFHRSAFQSVMSEWRWVIVAASGLLLGPLFVLDGAGAYYSTLGYSANYLAFGGIMMACLFAPSQIWNHRVPACLAAVGADSYSVYLWHMFIKRSLSYARKENYTNFPWIVEFLLFVVGSILFGMILAWAVEKPVLRLRDHWFPTRSGSLVEDLLRARTHAQPVCAD